MSVSHLAPHPTIAGAGMAGTMSGWSIGHILGTTGTLRDVLPVLVGGAFTLLAASLGHMRRRDVLDIKENIHEIRDDIRDLEHRVDRVEESPKKEPDRQ